MGEGLRDSQGSLTKGAAVGEEGDKEMALFPITGRFESDFVPHLVAVDDEDTMAIIAEKVAYHSVGRRVPPNPAAKGMEVLIDGNVIPDSRKLKDTGIVPLYWVDVRWKR
jgi:Toluene-4-monooxygenase system protein B (TmoB)